MDERHDRLTRLSDLSDYEVADNSPDVRGWEVVASDGRKIGEVEDLIVDTERMEARYLSVDVDLDTPGAAERGGESRGTVLVPLDTATVDEDRNKVVTGVRSSEIANLPRAAGLDVPADYGERFRGQVEPDWRNRASAQGSGERHMTRSAEEVRIGKRPVPAGEASVSKRVETEHVRQPVSRQREEVDIERRPVPERTRGQAGMGEEEVRVPLTEEEVVVEKRPVVKEELVVGKKTVEDKGTVETDVRREEFDIDRTGRDRSDR